MARKKRKPDYDNLTQDEARAARRRLRAELAKRVDPDTGPKPEWAEKFAALPPEARRQLIDEVRAFARLLCPGIVLPGDPLPPLRPDDAGAIADAADDWLAGDGAQ